MRERERWIEIDLPLTMPLLHKLRGIRLRFENLIFFQREPCFKFNSNSIVVVIIATTTINVAAKVLVSLIYFVATQFFL